MERDTSPAVARRYHEMLRALPGRERLEIAAGLTRGARDMAEAGLRHRHPGATDAEIRWRLAALLYGRAAAERLRGRAPAAAR